MFKLNDNEIAFIGLVLEALLYGVYSGIFAMYLQYHSQASRKDSDKKQNIVFYSICTLYVLSVGLFVAHNNLTLYQLLNKSVVSELHIYFSVMTLFGCCDFIAQFILIYRCWIVWGYNIYVVMLPSVLAFAFLIIWLVGGSSAHISSGEVVTPDWGNSMSLTSLVLSLTVNALVTGLIVFRIFKVFQNVGTTSNDHILLGASGGSKLRRTILILIESGMVLFSIQLVRVVVSVVTTDAALSAFPVVTALHDMLNGITPTIILVRTSMGLSFHDEKSMEEAAIGSLRFASSHHSVEEAGSITIVDRDYRDDDIGVERSNDIDILER